MIEVTATISVAASLVQRSSQWRRASSIGSKGSCWLGTRPVLHRREMQDLDNPGRPVPTVLLIRHGQASFGAADYDVLSATGERQAQIAAAALTRRGYRPSRIVTGSMRRQIDTAAAFAGPAPEVDPRWDEYDPNNVLTHHSESAARLDGAAAPEGEPLTSKRFQAILEPALAAWI